MKLFSRLRLPAALAAVLLLAGTRAGAQLYFGLGVTSSASSILVSNSLTYTINVTNATAGLLSDTLVSNVFSAPAQFVNGVPSQGTVTNYGNVVVFDLGPFLVNAIAQMTLTVQPSTAGFLTNTVSVSTPDFLFSAVSNSVVTLVTNAVPPQADLGVALTGPAQQTNIVNDPITYGIIATNGGPNDAPGVLLTNSLPAGVILEGVAPKNQPFSIVTSNLIFNLGNLASGRFTNLQVTVQATNAGVFAVSATVGAAGVIDTNSANNSAVTNFAVINYLSTNLTVNLVSTQTYNPQNGLVEQVITVSNVGPSAVPAARVLMTDLTNRFFNASGTNSGNPFVVYAAALAANQSVNLLLQFLAANYFPLTNTQLQAFGVPVPNLTPPPIASTSTNLNLSRILPLANGTVLLEFPAISNRAYTVVYSDNVAFSNAAIAPPSILATGNRLQWIDYGPPTTVALPTNSPARFYRVIQNP